MFCVQLACGSRARSCYLRKTLRRDRCGGAYFLSFDGGRPPPHCWGVVQPVGHHTVNVDGEGSNPSAPANFQNYRRLADSLSSRLDFSLSWSATPLRPILSTHRPSTPLGCSPSSASCRRPARNGNRRHNTEPVWCWCRGSAAR